MRSLLCVATMLGALSTALPLQAQQYELVPVHRLYHPQSGDHLYTNSGNEVLFALGNGFQDEGTPFFVEPARRPGFVPLYRHFDGHGHIYSAGRQIGGLKAEGIVGYVGTRQARSTVPLYEWYSPGVDQHLYTTDANGEGAPGFRYVGVVGYVYPAQ
ncbi:MAG: hypothetical protein K2R98_00850 [Gemmataceae bacterium]|nr:hypothetical protein [Gemmataceae bacterium]